MERVMSTISGTPANGGWTRSRGGALFGAVKSWWVAYLTHRMERTAIVHLQRLTDRELQDIGLTRIQISRAVRAELDHQSCASWY